MAYCGICGSVIHEYLGGPILAPKPQQKHPRTEAFLPVVMGHEMSGTVIELGVKAKGLNIGQKVAVNPLLGDSQYGTSPCVSCHATLDTAIAAVMPGGLSSMSQVHEKRLHVNINDFVLTEKKMTGGISYTPEYFQGVLEPLSMQAIPAEKLISSVVPLTNVIGGGVLELIKTRPSMSRYSFRPIVPCKHRHFFRYMLLSHTKNSHLDSRFFFIISFFIEIDLNISHHTSDYAILHVEYLNLRRTWFQMMPRWHLGRILPLLGMKEWEKEMNIFAF